MKLCPVCLRCYEDAETACSADRTALVAARPGTRMIADKYRLDRLLGRGGMGAVYQGTHVDLDRPVAIKLLLHDFIADADAVERFRREAKAAARLNHPNVADTYDYGVMPDGGAFIVMEVVEGQTLREYMDAAGQIPVAEAAEICKQMAEGVGAAHVRDIVHRDLKPSNIILAKDHQGRLQIKVVDFGVAKLKEHSSTAGGLTASGSLIGTPRYMSPEQCSGQQADTRSDIYSMGVILYEMLAGRPPFDAPTHTAIAIKHIQAQPPPLREARPDVTPQLERFVLRALDKDPEKRQQTAAEFVEQLSEASSVAGLPEGAVTTNVAPPGAGSERVAAGRDTSAFTAAPKITGRTGEPTGQHLSDSERFKGDPSVQGFAAPPVEQVTETATEVAGAPVERPVAVTKRVPPVSEGMAAATTDRPRGEDDAAHSRTRSRRVPPLLYALAPLLLVLAIAAIWFAISRNAGEQQAVGGAAPGGSAGTELKTPSHGSNTGGTGVVQTNTSTSTAAGQTGARAELKSALDGWVAATNDRDLERLITFYAPILEVFYQRRNIAQSAVRDEKGRQLAQARTISVSVTEPDIQLDPDGRSARLRFRKSWSISGAQSGAGEVLQELVWRRIDSGWRIVSERDLEVIRGASTGGR